uniref:Uncharacterized protein n=1 Tax=Glossina austeni TaxID=7395 RepID=A0A1A9UYX2_GLOAU
MLAGWLADQGNGVGDGGVDDDAAALTSFVLRYKLTASYKNNNNNNNKNNKNNNNNNNNNNNSKHSSDSSTPNKQKAFEEKFSFLTAFVGCSRIQCINFLVEIFIKFRSTIDYVRARIMTATPATFIGVDDDDDDYDTDVVQSLSISTHSSTPMAIPLAGAAVRNDIIEK